ncbi:MULTISPECIES: CRISPR-associated endoribonuclease Cas6 [Caloramator]|uniref:CRISPR-associated endoribonuclease n=1 Tax=Caloramator proteoclasticus DSM 10124 TaxID=1121262 RepID=A0A1M4YHR6_9CLOT|nr:MULTISPECIES: CRISPR-associated endoribonuclease Cas6 [Caloramator]SHF05270.1 CRISPR-associated protein, Cas6 family [Caloramator proteoclasticus DSM 10124]
MRVELNLEFDELNLPIHYNHIMQAVILKWINDEKYAQFIHDKGYEFNNRRYKLYTFSRLEGKFRLDNKNKRIIFQDSAKLLISSVDDEFLRYVVENYIENGSINIIGNEVKVKNIRYIYPKLDGNVFVTKSPITVYSTFERDGSKKTYYYNPSEDEFEELIKRNLVYKYNSYYDTNLKDIDIKITPVKETLNQSIVLYKGTVIKGWNGVFKIDASKEILEFAYGAGLGSKNSQGFGCIEEV